MTDKLHIQYSDLVVVANEVESRLSQTLRDALREIDASGIFAGLLNVNDFAVIFAEITDPKKPTEDQPIYNARMHVLFEIYTRLKAHPRVEIVGDEHLTGLD